MCPTEKNDPKTLIRDFMLGVPDTATQEERKPRTLSRPLIFTERHYYFSIPFRSTSLSAFKRSDMTMGSTHSKGEPELVAENDAGLVSKMSRRGSAKAAAPKSGDLEASRRQGIVKHTSDVSSSTASSTTKGSPGCFPPPINPTGRGGWLRRFHTHSSPVVTSTGESSSQQPPQQILFIPAKDVTTLTRDDKPTQPLASSRSRTLPIPPKRTSRHAQDDDDDDNVENLRRIYDMRTWNMYERITEARKRSHYKGHYDAPMPQPETTLDVDTSLGEHELFFGDMD